MRILTAFVALALVLSACAQTNEVPTEDAETIIERCGIEENIQVTETIIDQPPQQIIWANNDHRIVYIVSANNTVYKSRDEGSTWTNEMENLEDSEKVVSKTGFYQLHGVRAMFPTSDDSMVYFLGQGQDYWTCTGEQEIYTHYNIEHTVDDAAKGDYRLVSIRPHPTHPEWALMLLQTWACFTGNRAQCHQNLYLTQDFGASTSFVASYVFSFYWGGDETSFYYTAVPDATGSQVDFNPWEVSFFQTKDLGKSISMQRERTPSFLYKDGFLYLGVLQDMSTDHLSLWVSLDEGAHLTRAIFGDVELEENGYAILDNSEGASFVNVQHEDRRWGNLYSSNSFEEVFSVSLMKNKRNQRTADFQRLFGLDGLYIANYYDLPLEDELDEDTGMKPSDLAERKIKTVITSDKGAAWKRLQVPVNVLCDAPDCSLHLFGNTQSRYSPIYSKGSAVGLVLGTGNVGEFQQDRHDELNTFFSRDAGLTWELIRDGEHTYEMGDHGALLVLVNKEEPTNRLIYSWDEGLRFSECIFSDNPFLMDVTNVVVEPSATSQKFLLYGERRNVDGDGTHGLIVHVDFTGLHERECVGADEPNEPHSDYETWIPQWFDGECILGEQVSYVRRKRTARCYNGLAYETKTVVSKCPCTFDDFTCDEVCFEEHLSLSGDRICVNTCAGTADDPTLKPEECEDHWFKHKGYRLVAGDKCDLNTGENLLPELLPCKEGGSTSSGSSFWMIFMIISVVLLALVLISVIAAIVILFLTNDRFREAVEPYVEAFQTSRGGAYSSVGRGDGSGSLFDDDDEDDYDHFDSVTVPADDTFSLTDTGVSSLPPRRSAPGPLPEANDDAPDVPAIDPPSSSFFDTNLV